MSIVRRRRMKVSKFLAHVVALALVCFAESSLAFMSPAGGGGAGPRRPSSITLPGSSKQTPTIKVVQQVIKIEPQHAAHLVTIDDEARTSKRTPRTENNARNIVVALSVFSTYLLNNHANLGPIRASSMVGLMAAVTLPETLALAAVCGSFAGMARATVIPTKTAAAVLGIMCAIVLNLFDKNRWLIGFGGRLGFISQCACTVQFLLHKYAFRGALAALLGTMATTAKVAELSVYKNTGVVALSHFPLLTVTTVAGAIFMRLWKQAVSPYSQRLASTAAAVSATGWLAASCFPMAVAGPIFCGSFVAMAGQAILPDRRALLLASALAGVSQIAMTGLLLGGWGGRLGTAAFLGVLSYRLLSKLFDVVGAAVVARTRTPAALFAPGGATGRAAHQETS
jgi:hypothetical protein